MKCEIRIVSGARAGHRDVFEKSYIGVGRHPLSDVRFDAEQDLDASTRHAAIVRTGEAWVLRDLGSTNGTFVNGERIQGDRTLHDGDTLRFGFHGPEVTFHALTEHGEVVMEAVHLPSTGGGSAAPPAPPVPPTPPPAAADRGPAPAAEPPPAPRPPAPAPPRATADRGPAPGAPPPAAGPRERKGPSATSILRAELSEQQRRFRAVVVSLVILFVGAAAVVVWQGRTSSEVQTQLAQRVDSLTQEIRELRRLQASADSEAARLRTRIAAERDPARAQVLRQELTGVVRRSQSLVQAQTVDWAAITRKNRSAVAIIYVRFPDSSMWTGTAFSVNPTGLMLTNRHLVVSETGQQPMDVAVQFSGSSDIHPARVERVAADADLAVIRLESRGPFPAVEGLGADVPQAEGDPIGLLGFPLGLDLPQGAHPAASLFTGSISRTIPDSLLQLDAWSGTGASGSPIFDRNGRVIGVEFGGQRETGGRVVFGLPIRRAMGLLGS